MLGVSTQISIAVSNNLPTSVITTPLQWLNQQFSYTAQSLSVQYPLPIGEIWSYPIADHTKVRDEISYYLVRLGDCKIITETPVITSSAVCRSLQKNSVHKY